MSETAEIIPFPRGAGRAMPPAVVEDPMARLQIALQTLAAAQAEQRDAMRKWRMSLSALTHGLSALGSSLAATQRRLDQASPGAV